MPRSDRQAGAAVGTAVQVLSLAVIVGVLSCFALDLYGLSQFPTSAGLKKAYAHLAVRGTPGRVGGPVNPAAISWAPPDSRASLHVWTLGGSSLVLPEPGASFDVPFQRQMEARGHRVRLTNMAYPGVTSWFLRDRFLAGLQAAVETADLPDVVVVYHGHNDFSNTYRIVSQEPPAFDRLLRLRWWADWRLDGDLAEQYGAYRQLRIGSATTRLQRFGVHIGDGDFDHLDASIATTWISNIRVILSAAAVHDIPVIVVMPVGALEARPHGDPALIEPLYRAGLAADDYAEQVALLLRARELERLTVDIRAKTVLLDQMRTLSSPEVTVVDLPALWRADEVPFDRLIFHDYVHFNPAGFERFTNDLADVVVAVWATSDPP